jgi:hypothetical protein
LVFRERSLREASVSERGLNKPTSVKPIFVGSDPNLEEVALALLTAMELFFEAYGAIADVPYEGELSGWIAELMSKPTNLSLFDSQAPKPSPERQAIRESAAAMTDPRSEAEVQVVKRVVDNLSTDDTKRIINVLANGDRAAIDQGRREYVSKLQPALGEITREKLLAMMEQLKRFRALRAAGLCMVVYKADPFSIISRAKHGDRRAVLELVKVDNLFATDSCTHQVLRNAAIRADKPFMRQVANALTSRPKMGPKKVCRMYLYLLWSLNLPSPSFVKLQLRLDPQGEKFKSSEAFERIVERCHVDFLDMTAAVPTVAAK